MCWWEDYTCLSKASSKLGYSVVQHDVADAADVGVGVDVADVADADVDFGPE